MEFVRGTLLTSNSFLRKWYSVYDLGSNSVALAKAK